MSDGAPGRLFLVATPIGNLEDITLRALRVLKEADLIAAEDTRRTLKLLNHFEVKTPLVSCYQENERRRAPDLLRRLQDGQRIALVSDAGTPTISDPGGELVAAALAQGIALEVVPGPSAVLAALAGAGLPTRSFSFHGFLEARPGARRRQLESLCDRPETLVFFVAPHRVREALADAAEVLGEDRRAVLARELTKVHEEFQRGTLATLRAELTTREAKGEYTLVVAGGEEKAPSSVSFEDRLRYWQEQGLPLNRAVRTAAKETGLDPKTAYAFAHRIKEEVGK